VAKKIKKSSGKSSTKSKKAGDIIIPFSKEKEGKGATKVPEGDYRVRIVKVKPDTSESGNPMLIWDFEIAKGQKGAGKKVRDYTTLTDKSLWKVRSILEALGLDVPKKKDIKVNAKKLVGQELGVTLYDDEYESNGKTRVSSKISDYLDLDTLTGADEDDDEDEDEDDEDLDEDDDDESDDDEDEDEEDDDEDEDDDDDDLEEIDIDDEL
jgi:hypothetical protein